MKLRFILFASCIFFLNSLVFSQEDKGQFRRDFIRANGLMEDNVFDEALEIWLQMWDKNSENSNLGYKIGKCYLEIGSEKPKAIPYLEVATQKISKNYDPYGPSEKDAPVESFYLLAQAYHVNDDFDKAVSTWNLFSENAIEKHRLFSESKRQSEVSIYAKELKESPIEVEIQNLGDSVNSKYPEYSPVVTLDEGTIFFTSKRLRPDRSNVGKKSPEDNKYFEDIYVSYKNEDGKFGTPELLDLNTDFHEATVSSSADGLTLYIYKGDNGGDLYKSTQSGDNWSTPEPMGSDINTKYWETHITVSSDDQTLYFVSDRKEDPLALGGRDIYRCVRLPNGEWSKAFNVGAPINTPYDEESPFLSPDGKTLYFSSNGHKTMGGFDVFYTTMGEDGKWSEPGTLGYPINSVDDDISFSISADGRRAYYASLKNEGEAYGSSDLYMLEMPGVVPAYIAILKGKIMVPRGMEIPSDLTIQAVEVGNEDLKRVSRPRSRDGAYVFALKPCKEYHLKYFLGDELIHNDNITVPCESYSEIEKELLLNPLMMDTSGLLVSYISKDEAIRYRILKKDVAFSPEDGIIVSYTAEGSKKTIVEPVDENGYFAYHSLPTDRNTRFEISQDDVLLCKDLQIVKQTANGEEINRAVPDENCVFLMNPAEDKMGIPLAGTDGTKEGEITALTLVFKRHFGYNKRRFKQNEKDFAALIDKATEEIEKNGIVRVSVEGSASHVPTKAFPTNEDLAKARMLYAKEIFTKAMKKRGYGVEKIEFTSMNYGVNGPLCNPQVLKSKEEYGRHQYIKIVIVE